MDDIVLRYNKAIQERDEYKKQYVELGNLSALLANRVSSLVKELDEARRELGEAKDEHIREIERWQTEIYNYLVAVTQDDTIDGGGSDGDELAFTLAEIQQAICIVIDRYEATDPKRVVRQSRLSGIRMGLDMVLGMMHEYESCDFIPYDALLRFIEYSKGTLDLATDPAPAQGEREGLAAELIGLAADFPYGHDEEGKVVCNFCNTPSGKRSYEHTVNCLHVQAKRLAQAATRPEKD